jgi:4'-phosphopantetheinyl transferase
VSLPADAIRISQVEAETGDERREGLEAVLSDAERERAGRFRFLRDRACYVAAHAAVRHLLGAEVGLPPAAVRFCLEPRGKPALAPGQADRPIHFSLAHSGRLALVALAGAGAVGVDVEEVRPLADVLALARRMFAAEEHELLAALPEAERVPTFLQYWTRKEAALKMLGEGLRVPLAPPTGVPVPWVRDLEGVRPGYAAAVASGFSPSAIRVERWELPA